MGEINLNEGRLREESYLNFKFQNLRELSCYFHVYMSANNMKISVLLLDQLRGISTKPEPMIQIFPFFLPSVHLSNRSLVHQLTFYWVLTIGQVLC